MRISRILYIICMNRGKLMCSIVKTIASRTQREIKEMLQLMNNGLYIYVTVGTVTVKWSLEALW